MLMTYCRFFVLAFLTMLTATAQTPSPQLSSLAPPPQFTDPERARKLASAFPEIDRMMREFAAHDRVPGIAYGIIIDGKLAQVRTQGLREVTPQAPVADDSVFRIASMTKSFTAAAILQLRDAGSRLFGRLRERCDVRPRHPVHRKSRRVWCRHGDEGLRVWNRCRRSHRW